MYSLHFTAVDKAGNYKTGRGLFFYDNISEVDLQGVNSKTKCFTASMLKNSKTYKTQKKNHWHEHIEIQM
jgi:hypothetical protein